MIDEYIRLQRIIDLKFLGAKHEIQSIISPYNSLQALIEEVTRSPGATRLYQTFHDWLMHYSDQWPVILSSV